MTRCFGRNHDHVQIGARLDLPEVDVEAVGKRERRAFVDVWRDVLTVQPGLMLVGCEHHDDLRRFHRVVDALDGKAGALRLGLGSGAGPQADDHVDARVLEIVRMGVPLGSVADHRHFLRLDQ